MSARGSARGAASERRNEIFSQRGESEPEAKAAAQEDDRLEPLQLEHIVGYEGINRQTIVALKHDENLYMKSLGNLVSIENLLDPHNQILLRGHDMPISAISLSPSGSMIATGQYGTLAFKGLSAPIFIWTITGKKYQVLRGISVKVNAIAFSTDDKYVCGCGDDNSLYIWDINTAELIYGQKLSGTPSVLRWTSHQKVNHYTKYELVVGVAGALFQGNLQFEPDKVQWNMKLHPFLMPGGGGLVRSFTTVDFSMDLASIYIGTTAGEMMVFRRDTRVFRACFPICTNGLQSVLTLPNDDIVCGGGDGTLKIVRGNDMSWNMLQETVLEKGVSITSVTLSANCGELLVGTSTGTIYRTLSSNLSRTSIVGRGHTNPITCMTFSASNTIFVTGTTQGTIKVWDIVDYACTVATAPSLFAKSGKCLSLCLTNDDKHLIAGWEDGFIRCLDMASLSNILWYIPNAHRDGCRSLASYSDDKLSYFVSGGVDGAVRVWKLSNRELVVQYNEHHRGVCKVLVDIKSPNIIHSVGNDCTVLSYDLKSAKRRQCHVVTSGTMTDMTQRKDSENELITCDMQGRLLTWDIDMRDPVSAMQDPSRTPLRCVSVSPSGRYIAFAGDDFILKVLDLASNGQSICLGQGHSNSITCILWSPDERQVVTGGMNKQLIYSSHFCLHLLIIH